LKKFGDGGVGPPSLHPFQSYPPLHSLPAWGFANDQGVSNEGEMGGPVTIRFSDWLTQWQNQPPALANASD